MGKIQINNLVVNRAEKEEAPAPKGPLTESELNKLAELRNSKLGVNKYGKRSAYHADMLSLDDD